MVNIGKLPGMIKLPSPMPVDTPPVKPPPVYTGPGSSDAEQELKNLSLYKPTDESLRWIDPEGKAPVPEPVKPPANPPGYVPYIPGFNGRPE